MRFQNHAMMVVLTAGILAGVATAQSPALVSSDPAGESTLARTRNNVITLTFDGPITLPAEGGPALTVESIGPMGYGADLGGSFVYSFEPDGVTLRAAESGTVLTNHTWYRFRPTAGFEVETFELELCMLIGDADASGQVLPADLSAIWAHKLEHTTARWDIDEIGRASCRERV